MKHKIILSLVFVINFSIAKSQILQADSLVLVDIYYSAGVQFPSWLNGPVNTWTGVLVQNNRVTKLLIGNLNGIIPASIGNLTGLQVLSISNSTITGQLPGTIGNLINLTYLSFDSNSINSSIPAEIGNLINLKTLIFSNSHVYGTIPSTIGNLINLKELGLAHNDLTGQIPHEIGNLVNLNGLGLSYNKLEKSLPPEIWNLHKCYDIGLEHNLLTGTLPSNIYSMDSLVFLYINNNQFTGEIPASFTQVPILQQVIADSNHFSGIPQFYGSYHVDKVHIRYNRLTFEDIEPNMPLVYLDYFLYVPQDSVLTPIDTTIPRESNITLTSLIGGTANHYKWFKNSIEIFNSDNQNLVLTNVQYSDSGIYTCEITNDIVYDLTLYRFPIKLNITFAVYNKENLIDENQIQIFPNPSIDIITVNNHNSLQGTNIYITDVFGRNLYQECVQQNINFCQISVKNLFEGIYLVKVKSKDSEITGKFIKY